MSSLTESEEEPKKKNPNSQKNTQTEIENPKYTELTR